MVKKVKKDKIVKGNNFAVSRHNSRIRGNRQSRKEERP